MAFRCPKCGDVVSERFSLHKCSQKEQPPAEPEVQAVDHALPVEAFERLPDGTVEVMLPSGECVHIDPGTWVSIVAKTARRTVDQASAFCQVVVLPKGKGAVTMEYKGEKPFKNG